MGLRAVKLVGAPIESDPGSIWDGRATAAATVTGTEGDKRIKADELHLRDMDSREEIRPMTSGIRVTK